MASEKKKIVFVVNQKSGTIDKNMILTQIETFLDMSKYEYVVCPTKYAGHATELARDAANDHVDIVCAIGGDGTVNEIARALIHTDTALAIIPCGSGNGLARHLHIPLDPIAAIGLINDGMAEKIDYGRINLLPFFCTCGVGFDAFVSMKFAEGKRRGPMSYVENVLNSSLNYNPETYEVDIEEESEQHTRIKAFLISCANASQWGNNAYIAPRASVRDGLLDVTILEPFLATDVPQLAVQMFNGTLDKNSRIKTFRCKSISIHRKSPGVIHYDGDPIETSAEVDIAIVPAGLKCICPSKEGVFNPVENVQSVLAEQFTNIYMRTVALLGNNNVQNSNLSKINADIIKKLKKMK